jgi:hypothetical protein
MSGVINVDGSSRTLQSNGSQEWLVQNAYTSDLTG